ncbi:hypothetical protein N431DRAFT_554030 [Stipitochalara longipes BDJ]|nr:hypothetical protein N431DRAFT_554030 [Stipitochalara longipes BDJ]
MEKAPPYSVNEHSALESTPMLSYVWRPGTFRSAPWGAFASIAVSIVFAIGSAVIIVVSDQRPATWIIQPSVLLSLLASISTASLIVALTAGIAITWWRASLHPQGTTLAKLHQIWNQGGSIRAAILAGRDVNKVAVALILLSIAGVSYGPLLQRASHTKILPISTNITMFMDIFQQLPDGVSGTVDTVTEEDIILGTVFQEAIQDWFNQVGMQTYVDSGYACNGTCKANITSPGITGHCDTRNETFTMLSAAQNGTLVFGINFTRYDDASGMPTLEMNTRSVSNVDQTCMATLTHHTCKLYSAEILYPVIIEGINVTRDPDVWIDFDYSQPYTSLGDLASAPYNSPAGPLGGLAWFGETYFAANATISYNASSGTYNAGGFGVGWNQFFNTNPPDTVENLNCEFLWFDPLDTVMYAFADVLFRASLSTGQDVDNAPTEVFSAIQTRDTLTYQSNHTFLVVGSLVLLVAIAAVSWTLHGWWDLGRNVSLSPLEIAQAFGAEMLNFPNAPTDVQALFRQAGHKSVKYGQVHVADGDGIQRSLLRVHELGVGMDPLDPRSQ